jgi:diaminopimelate epimerase
MRFHKYQALGNDYLVLESEDVGPSDAVVRAVCDRHLGVGADGVLVEDRTVDGRLAVRIVNPDGSEAEKSGNGLRIFARYLWDRGRVGDELFEVATRGGPVRCQVRDAGRMVFVAMGAASFDSDAIPVAGPRRDVVDETIEVGGERLRATAVTVGNPHCVVFVDAPTEAMARRLGPALEVHPLFPRRTNVQFVRVVDRHRLEMAIWERGAGYTRASGSSACAAAAAAVRLGLCEAEVRVAMPGGELAIGVGAGFELTLLGSVGKVAEGSVAEDLVPSRQEPMPHRSPALTATVYAKDARRLAGFYADVLGLAWSEEGATFVVLTHEGVELGIVQAPPAIAPSIVVARPPVVREETPIKLSFLVDDVEAVRSVVVRLGGGLAAPEAVWTWRGYLHANGWDPEGNVFQLRQEGA